MAVLYTQLKNENSNKLKKRERFYLHFDHSTKKIITNNYYNIHKYDNADGSLKKSKTISTTVVFRFDKRRLNKLDHTLWVGVYYETTLSTEGTISVGACA